MGLRSSAGCTCELLQYIMDLVVNIMVITVVGMMMWCTWELLQYMMDLVVISSVTMMMC